MFRARQFAEGLASKPAGRDRELVAGVSGIAVWANLRGSGNLTALRRLWPATPNATASLWSFVTPSWLGACPEVVLAIHNIFGTVTVIVPESVDVRVEGGGAFASQVVDTPTAAPLPGAPVLRIRTSGPGGTLYVRSQGERQGSARMLQSNR